MNIAELRQNKLFLPGIIAGAVVLVLLLLIVVISASAGSGQNYTKEIKETSVIAYQDEIVDDYNMFSDDQQVLMQAGVPGTEEKTFRVTVKNGQEVSRDLINTQQTQAPQNRVFHKGALDRSRTTITINQLATSFSASLNRLDFASIYPLLTSDQRQLYTQDQLQTSAKAINFSIETFTTTGSVDYQYPKYLTDIDTRLKAIQDVTQVDSQTTAATETLVAVLPVSVTFNSDLIGRQEEKFNLWFDEENKAWKVKYFGPTEVLSIERARSRDDGGKTFGQPVGATITVHKMILFPYWNYVFFNYDLNNTSVSNTDAQGMTIPTDASLSDIKVSDQPGTGYKLIHNDLFAQAENTIAAGKDGVGRIIMTPIPGPAINSITISVKLKISNSAYYKTQTEKDLSAKDYLSDWIDFGNITLTRQNRQATLQGASPILNQQQQQAIDQAATDATNNTSTTPSNSDATTPASSPATTP